MVWELCTPNLHLHCHLSERISDFGPGHVFWLLGCERLNGILGSVPTNHSGIEMQLVRKFSTSQQVLHTFLQNTNQGILGTHLIAKGTLMIKIFQNRCDILSRLFWVQVNL